MDMGRNIENCWQESSNSTFKKYGFNKISIWDKWKSTSLAFYFIFRFFWSMCLGTIFLWCSEKLNFKPKISTRVNQINIKSSSKDLGFDQWKTFCKNYESITVWLLLLYKIAELQVHLNSKQVSYLPWQNKYSY